LIVPVSDVRKAVRMKVVVTGGSGKLGRFVVDDLVTHGHDVLNVDGVRPDPARSAYLTVDLTDYGQVLEALTGVDEQGPAQAVVHLAAIPAPGLRTNAATFANNAPSTYNVFAAARAAGIKNDVWAVLGLPFDTPPPYAPIDEEYAPRPESTYSLVKTLEEEMARQFCRWDPQLKMIGLRFSNVMAPSDYASFEDFQQDPLLRKWNLWGYIDGRDGAQAVRLALEAPLLGTDVFIIANADTVMRRDSADLLREVYPDVPLQRPVVGRQTLLSIDKARRVLGYDPQHGWRDPAEA
jgi:nucleoside-diphosphate-sugar epimerase